MADHLDRLYYCFPVGASDQLICSGALYHHNPIGHVQIIPNKNRGDCASPLSQPIFSYVILSPNPLLCRVFRAPEITHHKGQHHCRKTKDDSCHKNYGSKEDSFARYNDQGNQLKQILIRPSALATRYANLVIDLVQPGPFSGSSDSRNHIPPQRSAVIPERQMLSPGMGSLPCRWW